MTYRSLFKEVAQRIVESAQSSHTEASPGLPGSSSMAARLPGQPGQMNGSTFGSPSRLTSPTDTSPVPRR